MGPVYIVRFVVFETRLNPTGLGDTIFADLYGWLNNMKFEAKEKVV